MHRDAVAATGPVGDRAFCLVDADSGHCLRTVENPTLRIDYILTANGATATSAEVIRTTASDHLPIVAELSITKTPNGKVK